MGLRQSMPSSSIESCAPDNATVPWVACGHTNRPRSSRFENMHRPSPLHHRIFTRSPARPRNTKSCPENGSSASCVCTNAASPSNPLRISVAPAASHTCMPAGSAIIVTTMLRSDPSTSPDPRGLVCAVAVLQQTQPRSKHLPASLQAWMPRRVRLAAVSASTPSPAVMLLASMLLPPGDRFDIAAATPRSGWRSRRDEARLPVPTHHGLASPRPSSASRQSNTDVAGHFAGPTCLSLLDLRKRPSIPKRARSKRPSTEDGRII